MQNFWDIFKPKALVDFGGLALVLIVVFLENGIFFGFFLPGDSLLFTVGLLCYLGVLKVELGVLIAYIAIAAFLGYYAGYYFGYKTGQALYRREDSLFFKKNYIYTAEDFYKKYGGLALIMGRFLPIVRTFAPILAGVVRVKHRTFFLYNIAGAVLWPSTIVTAGYFVGQLFPNALDYLDFIVIGFIVVTTIPIVNNVRKKRKSKESDPY
ncbi:MAG: DedA family protein [Bacteroidota bacterium]